MSIKIAFSNQLSAGKSREREDEFMLPFYWLLATGYWLLATGY
jgi:hypothetical protein